MDHPLRYITLAIIAAATVFLVGLSGSGGLAAGGDLLWAIWLTGPMIAAFVAAAASPGRLMRMSVFSVFASAGSAWIYHDSTNSHPPDANGALIFAVMPVYLWGGFLFMLGIGSGIWPFKNSGT